MARPAGFSSYAKSCVTCGQEFWGLTATVCEDCKTKVKNHKRWQRHQLQEFTRVKITFIKRVDGN